MSKPLTIGAVAREAGVAVRTIRFYEDEGVLPAPPRTPAGYRQYTAIDVRRLRLARHARLLGLGLGEVRELVERAFASDCSTFAPELSGLIAARRSEVRARIRDLERLHDELGAVEEHVRHAACAAQPGLRVADCEFCLTMDTAAAATTRQPGARQPSSKQFSSAASAERRARRGNETQDR